MNKRLALRYHVTTTIVCKNFVRKCIIFRVSLDQCCGLLPNINVDDNYFCVLKGYAVKIINIAKGGGMKFIREGRVNDFQNMIFAHDCRSSKQ